MPDTDAALDLVEHMEAVRRSDQRTVLAQRLFEFRDPYPLRRPENVTVLSASTLVAGSAPGPQADEGAAGRRHFHVERAASAKGDSQRVETDRRGTQEIRGGVEITIAWLVGPATEGVMKAIRYYDTLTSTSLLPLQARCRERPSLAKGRANEAI